jgi:peptide/nickel transport system permease protein
VTRYLVARLAQSIVVVLGVLFLVFVILQLTGDPARLMSSPQATLEDIERLRRQMGFDRPLPEQFLRFFAGAVRGDFGPSLRYTDQPALQIVIERFPATVQLALATLAWSVPVALLLGLVAAVWRPSLSENVAMLTALLGQSMPSFWLGLMLILIFSVNLGLFPSSGRGTPAHVVLPALTLGGFFMARLTRLVRSGLLDVLGQDYVRTARAKGLKESVITIRHALRNALIPVITILGPLVVGIITGGVVIENIFGIPGLGKEFAQSILSRDYNIVIGVFTMYAAMIGLANLVVDVLYAVIDPRIRY